MDHSIIKYLFKQILYVKNNRFLFLVEKKYNIMKKNICIFMKNMYISSF